MKPIATALLAALVLAVPAFAQRGPQVQVQVVNKAQNPVPVQDANNAARNAFQASVVMDYIAGVTYSNIAIPTGKRLVVDFVSISGTATTPSGPVIQPRIALQSILAGGNPVLFDLGVMPLPTIPKQFESNHPVMIYADSLAVLLNFSGFPPDYLTLQVSISGHLVTL